jgi:hypothetical protein
MAEIALMTFWRTGLFAGSRLSLRAEPHGFMNDNPAVKFLVSLFVPSVADGRSPQPP